MNHSVIRYIIPLRENAKKLILHGVTCHDLVTGKLEKKATNQSKATDRVS